MKREELERLRIDGDWRVEDFQTDGFELDMAKLLAAAPALALACLEAYDLIYSEPVGSDREMALDVLQEKLTAALAAAGVEVQDGD